MESILDPEVILVVINADLPPQKVCMVARSQEDVDYAIAIMRRGLINTQPQAPDLMPWEPAVPLPPLPPPAKITKGDLSDDQMDQVLGDAGADMAERLRLIKEIDRMKKRSMGAVHR